jgi:hypothetical protein
MKIFCIQIQPELSPGIDVEAAVAAVCRLDASARVSRGNDDGTYVNLRFEVPSAAVLWNSLQQLLKGRPELAQAAIVVCEGSYGWDDYLLLHHFDADEPLDQLR